MKLSLKAARANAGFTQEQVKQCTGISRSSLSSWEHGTRKPHKKNKLILSKLYKISMDDIAW